MDCLFCKIIEGKIPSKKVFENEDVFAFKDIQAQAPVHYLFVPKRHVDSLATLPTQDVNLMGRIYEAIKKVADDEGLSAAGYRTVINTNRNGGQTVFHLHVHLIGGKPLGGNMAGA